MANNTVTNSTTGEEAAYYMIVFGSEQEPNVMEHSHTFGAFLRGVTAIERRAVITPPPRYYDVLCISWLPDTMVIHPFQLRPEKGKNFSLTDTLNWVTQDQSSHIYAWGPFLICPELYKHATLRIAQLDSGDPKYVVEDACFRPNCATNCIHALSDLGLTKHLLHTLASHGREASCKVVHYLSPWIKNPSEPHKEIRDEFGLKPFEDRISYLDYRSDGILAFLEP